MASGIVHYEYWDVILEKVNKSKITKFIKSKEWKSFYEIWNYTFNHGFIPTNNDYGSLRYVDDWRKVATEDQWMNARWTYHIGYKYRSK